jgi:outer membrane receptor protein involved in Fe transport
VAGGESVQRTARSVTDVDGWVTANLSGGVRFGGERQFWVGAEVLNIFDEEYRPATDELVQPGRHINISARLDF